MHAKSIHLEEKDSSSFRAQPWQKKLVRRIALISNSETQRNEHIEVNMNDIGVKDWAGHSMFNIAKKSHAILTAAKEGNSYRATEVTALNQEGPSRKYYDTRIFDTEFTVINSQGLVAYQGYQEGIYVASFDPDSGMIDFSSAELIDTRTPTAELLNGPEFIVGDSITGLLYTVGPTDLEGEVAAAFLRDGEWVIEDTGARGFNPRGTINEDEPDPRINYIGTEGGSPYTLNSLEDGYVSTVLDESFIGGYTFYAGDNSNLLFYLDKGNRGSSLKVYNFATGESTQLTSSLTYKNSFAVWHAPELEGDIAVACGQRLWGRGEDRIVIYRYNDELNRLERLFSFNPPGYLTHNMTGYADEQRSGLIYQSFEAEPPFGTTIRRSVISPEQGILHDKISTPSEWLPISPEVISSGGNLHVYYHAVVEDSWQLVQVSSLFDSAYKAIDIMNTVLA